MGGKIDTRAAGLDIGLAFIRFLTGKENLHYGLWRANQPVCAAEIGAAQEAYTEKLFGLLPPAPLRILDIGGGAGETARKLLALGNTVEIVIPSAVLAERCRANAPQATVQEMRLEEFETESRFDICLFSESFQYIPPEIALDRAAALLAPGGRIVIADCFRTQEYFEARKQGPVVGGGYALERFERALAERPGLHMAHREDITEAVAPSVEVEQAFYNTLGFALRRADTELARGRPRQRAALAWIIGRLLGARRRARLSQRLFEQTRTAAAFCHHNRYLMMVLDAET
jgi:SAM-dependent methyltransferase